MNKIFLDINEFKNTYPLMQALKTYNSINGRSHFLIKADGNEYQILDDLKFIKRRIKFDEDDLNEWNFNLKTYESFDTFKRNKSHTYFRILDDSKNNKKTLYLFYSKDITFNELNEKLAELLLQGTNMGIIEGRRLLNNKSGDEKVDKLVEEYVNMQEKFVEILKKYL